jgi:hypothetical protein
MLVHPRPMCPRPKILGCSIPWTKCPLAILTLTEPSHPFDLIERSDTRLPTAAHFSAAKRWSSTVCVGRACIQRRGALFKGRNIQEFSVGDTSVGDTSTLRRVAAIWAEQQLVAIPGWLHEDRNARLDQEGQFASIKEPRLTTIKKNRAKKELLLRGEGEQDGDPSHFPPPPPQPPVATSGPRPASFQKSPRIWKKAGGF